MTQKKHIAYYDTPIVNPESDSVIKILVNQYFLSYSTAPTIQYTQHGANEVSESGEGLLGQAGLGRCQMTSYVNLIVLMRMLFTRSRIMSEAS